MNSRDKIIAQLVFGIPFKLIVGYIAYRIALYFFAGMNPDKLAAIGIGIYFYSISKFTVKW